ncbi:Ig-like domain-containing protein [Staphylococcus aureus]|uniref:Ig-like domain-containing protein n=1 Tax=Staphylococcus aureus TaxID=1280 RepID=UPI000447D125|nr:Ig-like domain-containing protein [Staphylococcus aureus]EZY68687.1 hypothetical protein V063_02574 [Staphylococcus aureus R0487]MBH4787384.1 Ig-like domain-containing protein [Staphylococcus aureus]MBH4847016.1 Ig-like domain-containing protein [Staphylococcus aureus]MBH4849545.1 Ig-like domain-containing protein [Staphylococcus aureus]MBH4852426.1 Ig-like domain-containing protein [Staphylococcus aureus]
MSDKEIESVNIPDKVKTLHVGETYDLNVTVEPDSYKGLVKYTTSQSDVVSISEGGQITAESQGVATVKATAGNKSDSITINVEA